jgi:hypothetical protein
VFGPNPIQSPGRFATNTQRDLASPGSKSNDIRGGHCRRVGLLLFMLKSGIEERINLWQYVPGCIRLQFIQASTVFHLTLFNFPKGPRSTDTST